MTAAGIALIAGGLATLISFRAVLFGGDGRRTRASAPAGIQPKSRRAGGARRRNRVPEAALAPDPAPASEPAPGVKSAPASEAEPLPDAMPASDAMLGSDPVPAAGPADDPADDWPGDIRHAEPHDLHAGDREFYAEERAPYVEEPGLYAEQRALYAEDHELYGDDRDLYAEDRELYAEGHELFEDAPAAAQLLDREPAGREPLDRWPLNREPLDREPPDSEQLNRVPSDRRPLDREPPDSELLNRVPLDRRPLDRELEPEPLLELDNFEDELVLPYQQERYGHRVEGWVRPEYRHVPEEPPAGEYWTPIPVGLEPDPEPSAKGYGWPMAVERLPAAPDYEPATGVDLAPVEHEPTEVVSPVPLRRRHDRAVPVGDRTNRIHLPRSWSARDDKYQEPAAREWRTENESPPSRRRAESTQMVGDPPPSGRRRPRPRPRPSAEPADRSTTMYVSRHAAEPPPR